MLADKPYGVVKWSKDGQPLSRQFDDIYFSKENGMAESHYVFLQQSDFLERTKQQPLTIVETGFGTGLNFLQVLEYAQQPVHYYAIEKYPLRPEDIHNALKTLPLNYKQSFIEQYSPYQQTSYRFKNIQLHFMTMDILEALKEISEQDILVDIWFLDGFAPAKNPQMWPEELFQTMAKQHSGHTTFSTFTAAAKVRKGLETAGFIVEKIPGYGHKRQMLKGYFPS